MDTARGEYPNREDRRSGAVWPLPDGGVGGSAIPSATPRQPTPAPRSRPRATPPPTPLPTEQPIVEGEYREEELLLEGFTSNREWLWDSDHPAVGWWLRVHLKQRPSDGRVDAYIMLDAATSPLTERPKLYEHDYFIRIDPPARLAEFADRCPPGRGRQILHSAAQEYERLRQSYFVLSISEEGAYSDEHRRRFYNDDYLSNIISMLAAFTVGSIEAAGKKVVVEQYAGGKLVATHQDALHTYNIWLFNGLGEQVDRQGAVSQEPAYVVFAASESQAMRLIVRSKLGIQAALGGVRRIRAGRFNQQSQYQPVEASFYSFFSHEEWDRFLGIKTLPAQGEQARQSFFEELASMLLTLFEHRPRWLGGLGSDEVEEADEDVDAEHEEVRAA